MKLLAAGRLHNNWYGSVVMQIYDGLGSPPINLVQIPDSGVSR